MITYQELANAFGNQTAWQSLASKYGREEVLNSVELYDKIGADDYRTQFSQIDEPATARGSTVPYDREAGLFSLKNLGALAENFPTDAVRTYDGLKAVYDDPALLGQVFSKEGAAAIADDFAELLEDPAKRIVEQPFTTLLDVAPATKGAAALTKKVLPRVAPNLSNKIVELDTFLHERTPKMARLIDEGSELATDPLKTTLRAGKGVIKLTQRAGDEAFAVLGKLWSGIDSEAIKKALDAPRLSKKQKVAASAYPAYTPSGAAARLIPGRLGVPNVETTPLRYFKEVVTGVRDESVILRDMLNAVSEINGEMNDIFRHTLPDLFSNMQEKFDLMPAVDKWKETLTQPLNGIKVTLQQQESQKVIKNAQLAGGRASEKIEQTIQVMVPKITIDAKHPGSAFRGMDTGTLDQAVEFLNDHFKSANNLNPQDAYILLQNIDNLINNVPIRGADKAQAMLADLRHHIRDQFTEMTEKLPGGRTINEQLKAVDERMVYLNDLQKEFRLYTKGKGGGWETGEVPSSVNAGSILKKIMGGGRNTEKYRQALLARMEARVGPITTGLAALQMKEALSPSLHGKALMIGAVSGAGGLAATGSSPLAAFGLLSTLQLSSPRLMSRWARWLGYHKRVGDYVEALGKEINNNKTTRMMADAGYTVGGILLNHGKIRAAADKRYSEDQHSKRLSTGSKRKGWKDF